MMKKAEILFSTYIENKVILDVSAYKLDETLEEMTIEDLINNLSENELRQLFIDGPVHFMVHEYSVRGVVKRAIDNFDPYVIGPNADGHYDEYDPEVDAITKRLSYGMTEEDIRRIIESVFIYYFNASYPSEFYKRPAIEIHRFLDDVLQAPADGNTQDDV